MGIGTALSPKTIKNIQMLRWHMADARNHENTRKLSIYGFNIELMTTYTLMPRTVIWSELVVAV